MLIFIWQNQQFVIKMIMHFSCKSLRICRICMGDIASIMIHINGLKMAHLLVFDCHDVHNLYLS